MTEDEKLVAGKLEAVHTAVQEWRDALADYHDEPRAPLTAAVVAFEVARVDDDGDTCHVTDYATATSGSGPAVAVGLLAVAKAQAVADTVRVEQGE